MIKITITIEEVADNKAKKNNIIKGKYIITRSNYIEAYIRGVPCKVVSEPFMGAYEYNTFAERECMCIKVVSCITGVQYTIPYDTDWLNVYDTFTDVLEASESFMHRGYTIYPHPETQGGMQIKGKKYYPICNTYAKLLSTGEDGFVAGEEVKILTTPYIDTTPYGERIPFVTVRKNNGSLVKCMFTEWKLLP